MSTTFAYAATDFFHFGAPMSSNNWYGPGLNNAVNPRFSTMNGSNWSNPYAYNTFSNPVSRLFGSRNNSSNTSYVNDSDYEYLLSKMERNRFGQAYTNLDIDNRLDRLDSQVFGTIQSGDYKTRLNRLKNAFSAESTRGYKVKKQRLNDFREFFSSGSPTSVPASGDYYSSLGDDFSSW